MFVSTYNIHKLYLSIQTNLDLPQDDATVILLVLQFTWIVNAMYDYLRAVSPKGLSGQDSVKDASNYFMFRTLDLVSGKLFFWLINTAVSLDCTSSRFITYTLLPPRCYMFDKESKY